MKLKTIKNAKFQKLIQKTPDGKKKKIINEFNNYNKYSFEKKSHSKSSKLLIVHKDLEIEKISNKIGHKSNIFNLEGKDSSFDFDSNNFENSVCKEFFSPRYKKYQFRFIFILK